jgi:hypothetical protein
VHIRRRAAPVLYCDFLSMYPTVCTLMGLWQFVIADGIGWRDSTGETRKLLDKLTIADLDNPRCVGPINHTGADISLGRYHAGPSIIWR